MSTNDKLYEEAMAAIKRLYSDMSVSQEETATSLRTLKDEIDVLLDTLE